MDNDRFNELINGPLHHPVVTLALTRLVAALWSVVQSTGSAGSEALEAHCRQVEQQDREF